MDVNKVRREAQKLQGKAGDFLKEHHDQIESGVTKAETFAKRKTKNQKRDAQIDKVAGKLKGLIPSEQPKGPNEPKAAPADKPKAPDEGGAPGPSGLG